MKLVFSGNDDFRKSGFLNWRTDKEEDILNLIVLAEGYLNAAIELAKTCIADNDDKKADMLIFPMLANANHGIELYLKSLNWTLNILTGQTRKIEGAHNIKQILQNVKSRIKEFDGQSGIDAFDQSTQGLEEYINELFDKVNATTKDNKMDFSRYPFDKDYVNHFYIDEINNIEIDLENFIARFQQILAGLDERASYFYYHELKGDW